MLLTQLEEFRIVLTTVSHSDLVACSAGEVRAAIRSGSYDQHTAGLAAGKLQCNLAREIRLGFLALLSAEPKALPNRRRERQW